MRTILRGILSPWRGRRWAQAAHLALLACVLPLLLPGQTDPLLVNRVKAGFLFNFARFTQWPDAALPAGAPLRIGVLGKPEAIAVVRSTLSGKSVAQHPVEVTDPVADTNWEGLHMLYVTSSSSLEGEELAARLRTPALLTIGDAPDFASTGGIIAFFERDGKLRFRINPATAKNAGLQVSGQLASLAEIVRK